jgi:rhamnogalacturonyl hydrolase YesR
MWLDGLYMVSPFYAHYTSYYDSSNTTAYNDIVKQFTLTHTNCVNSNSSQTGLLKHGYDSSHTAVWADAATGASPECWNRALGWYVIAIVDVLDYLPSSHPGFATLKSILVETVAGIKKAVDSDSSLWWLVMTQPGKTKNYIESSGSAMFVYAILKGIRIGYLDSATYKSTAVTAYEKLVSKFVTTASDGGLDWAGTVSVGSLSGKGDFDVSGAIPTALF